MISRSNMAWPLKSAWAKATLVATALLVGAPAARAEGFFDLFEPSPHQIARGLEGAGWEMRSALVRRGDVYVCDVATPSGAELRLVIDARTGQLIQRFPTRRWRGWGDRDLRDAYGAPPRPPRPVYDTPDDDTPDRDADDLTPHSKLKTPAQVARGDSPLAPKVVYGDESDDSEKPIVKPKIAKHKSAPMAKVAPVTDAPIVQSNATPSANADPSSLPVRAPGIETPPVTAAPPIAAVAPASEAPKPVADAPKPAVEPPKAVAEAKPMIEVKAATPAPRPTPKPKAVNDLPVTPLD